MILSFRFAYFDFNFEKFFQLSKKSLHFSVFLKEISKKMYATLRKKMIKCRVIQSEEVSKECYCSAIVMHNKCMGLFGNLAVVFMAA